ELVPSGLLSQNEIDAAKLVHFDYLNVQDQPKLVWPASFVVARAYLDQLARSNGLAPDKVSAARTALARAERLAGPQRRDALTQLAAQLNGDSHGAADGGKVSTLAYAVLGRDVLSRPEVVPAWEIHHQRNGAFGRGAAGKREQQLGVDPLQRLVPDLRVERRPTREARHQEPQQARRIIGVPPPGVGVVAGIIPDEGEVRDGLFREDVGGPDDGGVQEFQRSRLQSEARLGEGEAPFRKGH